MEHAALRQRFVGTWKLVATRATLTDGPEVPYGSDPLGYITYTDDGYMHAIFGQRFRVASQRAVRPLLDHGATLSSWSSDSPSEASRTAAARPTPERAPMMRTTRSVSGS